MFSSLSNNFYNARLSKILNYLKEDAMYLKEDYEEASKELEDIIIELKVIKQDYEDMCSEMKEMKFKIKEADNNIAKLIKSISLCEDKLDFYIGNDDMIAPAVFAGCKGVISVIANILPIKIIMVMFTATFATNYQPFL